MSTEPKWTKGPWRAGFPPNDEPLRSEDEDEIACLPHARYDAIEIYVPYRAETSPHVCEWHEFQANARLIAAAPTLYVALQEIAEQDEIELALDPDWSRRIAKAALVKANGGTS